MVFARKASRTLWKGCPHDALLGRSQQLHGHFSSALAELLEDLSSSGPSTPREGKPGGDPASECSCGLQSVGRNCTVTPENRKN